MCLHLLHILFHLRHPLDSLVHLNLLFLLGLFIVSYLLSRPSPLNIHFEHCIGKESWSMVRIGVYSKYLRLLLVPLARLIEVLFWKTFMISGSIAICISLSSFLASFLSLILSLTQSLNCYPRTVWRTLPMYYRGIFKSSLGRLGR